MMRCWKRKKKSKQQRYLTLFADLGISWHLLKVAASRLKKEIDCSRARSGRSFDQTGKQGNLNSGTPGQNREQ